MIYMGIFIAFFTKMTAENAWTGKSSPQTNELGESALESAILFVLNNNLVPVTSIKQTLIREYPQFTQIIKNEETFSVLLEGMKNKGMLDEEAYDKGVMMRSKAYFNALVFPPQKKEAEKRYG